MERMHIRDEAGEIIPMRFSDSQNVLWQYDAPRLDANEPIRDIVLKGRQVYATTYYENFMFIRTMERANTNSLIIAQNLDDAREIFEMAQRFYENLPLKQMKPSRVKEVEFPFKDGSSKLRVASSGTLGRGRGTTKSCLHVSELAFWEHADVLTGILQTVPYLSDTMVVLESTANGMGGRGALFYDQWQAAVKGMSMFQPIFIPWYVMPKYRMSPAVPETDQDDEEKLLVDQFGSLGLDGFALSWRRYAIDSLVGGSVEMFHQEYPSFPEEAFISKGLPAFDIRAILAQQKNVRVPVEGTMTAEGKFEPQPRGEVRVWKTPEAGGNYMIGVDTSEGLQGGDFACAQVLDMRTLEQVALVHGLLQPYDFARLLNALGRWYNLAMLSIEVQSTGYAVQDYLLRLFTYPRLHPWRGKPDQIKHAQPRLWGWVTNVYSRPLLIEAGRRAINKGLVTLHDRGTLEEIKNFSRSDTGKYEAEAGHDDRVLALLIALRSRQENYFERAHVVSEPTLISNLDQLGIRTVEAAEMGRLTLKQAHKLLRVRAKAAIKSWMSL